MKDGKMTLMFNDNINNYTEAGDYNGNVYEATYYKNTNVFAMVELDLESGNYVRKLILGPEFVNLYAVPQDFKIDYKNNQVLMLFVLGKKEQFGKLDF